MVLVNSDSLPSLPCNWDVSGSICCDEWDTYTDELQEAAANYGALVVWAATGRRFGLCEKTVRPCGRTQSTMLNAAGYYWSEGTWQPYVFNGLWRNCAGCGAGFGCCTCEPTCQVWLPGPIYSIPATGITVGADIIPVDAWRVDNGQWLVRTDGDCWPQCQDFDTDAGDTFFQVTYFKGIPVPSVLAQAAGELACEWAKSCLGAPCRLPQRVTSLSRQGVSVSLPDVSQLLEHGLTGVPTVDQLIRSFNPYGLTSAMGIASPDWPPSTRTVTFP
ncbi:MAG TPA: hypothetical protein VK899_02320 [Gemmatimonadales bacterium]|nr:hypothetical protein [Gemmatimonadales bacterium]